MAIEKTLIKFGLSKDEDNIKIKELFKHNARLKEIHIDTYAENPLISSSTQFMLLLRLIEKKMFVSNNNERLILKKTVNNCETYFMNVLFSEIKECYYKINECYSEFILNIQNIWYRITIIN